jgi:hypothetical protein
VRLIDYSCTYQCPEQCDDGYEGWPASGEQLVDEMCISGSGGGGQGGSGGASAGGSGTGGQGG